MKFDVYYPFRTKDGRTSPGIKPQAKTWSEILQMCKQEKVSATIDEIRKCDPEADKERKAELKKQLPAICWTGRCVEGTRKASNCEPTQMVMIDLDSVEDWRKVWEAIWEKYQNLTDDSFVLVHLTPSKGIRIVFQAHEGYKTLAENMAWWRDTYFEDWMGAKFDVSVKDYSRLSFAFKAEEVLYANTDILNDTESLPERLEKGASVPASVKLKPNEENLFANEYVSPFTEEEKEKFENWEYRGTPIKVIIEKYISFFGEPGSGEKHNFYNDMVKNFRCITDNNKRALLYLLPRFGHTLEECNSQINSICRVNTLSTLPKKFYFFLKDNGFYNSEEEKGSLRAFMMEEKEEKGVVKPPYLPPVFRELVGTAPTDFIIPCVNSLLPILGTLTSYVQARYPYDDRLHTTSFFSVIYAPPSTGKGFVERFMDLLFEELRIRDFVQSQRENVYLRVLSKKSQNERSPDMPHTSLRLIPAKNSEAEFLQKQQDNHGYHMFTYAAEMDSWAKGARAAGGNKDDMIRIAWDNGEYGQQFKSYNTFKGTVRLYWNVLINGTIEQLQNYFKNVENGLVTRCSFTSIDNQEFTVPAKWKQLSAKKKEVVRAFAKRCDENTYEEPCDLVPSEIMTVSDDDFDKQVKWRFKFKERQTVDCSWIMPVIDEFQQEQLSMAVRDVDRARDVFRRRVGVRGFRLALICMCLWENPRLKDLEKCKPFIRWWMERDIEQMLLLWGDKYNEQTEDSPRKVQRVLFDELPNQFGRNDVYVLCMKQGIKTPIRRILFEWKKLKYIEQTDKDKFVKK